MPFSCIFCKIRNGKKQRSDIAMTTMRKRFWLSGGIVTLALLVMGFDILHMYGVVGATRKNGYGCICHDYLPSPDVRVWIEGPKSVRVGVATRYTVYLSGGPSVAGGYNVASGHGTLFPFDSTSILMLDELTHSSPLKFVRDTVQWEKDSSACICVAAWIFGVYCQRVERRTGMPICCESGGASSTHFLS